VRPGAVRFFILLLVCLASPLLLVSLGQRAPAVNLLWDWANAMGYCALAVALMLFVYTGRPRAFPAFSGRFFANLHRDFGYITLALVVGHIGILLYDQPLLLEHLKITAPVHMLAGLASAVALLVLVVSSITSLRRYLWRDHQRFRGFHAWLSIAVVLLLLVHVVGSAYYLNSVWKMAICLTAGAIVLGLYLDKRYVHLKHDRTVTRHRNTAHYAPFLTYGSVALVLLISLGLVAVSGGGGE
jgi:hypothetical protein